MDEKAGASVAAATGNDIESEENDKTRRRTSQNQFHDPATLGKRERTKETETQRLERATFAWYHFNSRDAGLNPDATKANEGRLRGVVLCSNGVNACGKELSYGV